MHTTRLLPLLGTLLLAPAAGADTLTFDPNIVAAPDGPPRYATMEEVEARFGVPERRSGPVGEPPITVWHYSQFKVYFEFDRVLHSTALKKARGLKPAG